MVQINQVSQVTLRCLCFTDHLEYFILALSTQDIIQIETEHMFI